ncbi:hypothetical protein NP233_g9412 [Leucocoprinus birnbaumii]|uniref:Ricin B lectin domain-containing protein n=1 Tax=Leucocoprinus birnbaumii TaxID=56174 RepID=A0AAD5YSW6_9AGAR|nr:hypothetical protein NP233_g9412 [Leucocoprinus birnbaumii]
MPFKFLALLSFVAFASAAPVGPFNIRSAVDGPSALLTAAGSQPDSPVLLVETPSSTLWTYDSETGYFTDVDTELVITIDSSGEGLETQAQEGSSNQRWAWSEDTAQITSDDGRCVTRTGEGERLEVRLESCEEGITNEQQWLPFSHPS